MPRGLSSYSWQNNNAGTIVVSQAYVCAGSPVAPTEKTVLVGADALTDANATCFDVTCLAETGLSYNPTNPNALFIANDGQMTNTKNVIVGTTCANLEIVDGKPFKAPKNFTATTAKYNTTINTDAKVGTLCLPFAATIPSDVQAYTLEYTGGTSANATEVTGTIPANTPVLLNCSGEVTFSGSGAVSASATNVSGAMTGVFEATAVPTGSYVLQNGSQGVGFYKVNSTDIIAAPFRAYVTAQSAGSRLNIVYAGETTSISSMHNSECIMHNEVYDLQGRQVSNGQMQRGLYIVNGKKIMVK